MCVLNSSYGLWVCMYACVVCACICVCMPVKLAGALEIPGVSTRQVVNTPLPIYKQISLETEGLGTCSAPFLLKEDTHCISRLSSSETASITLDRTRGTSSLETVNT